MSMYCDVQGTISGSAEDVDAFFQEHKDSQRPELVIGEGRADHFELQMSPSQSSLYFEIQFPTNFPPVEMEQLLNQHPNLQCSGYFSTPDPDYDGDFSFVGTHLTHDPQPMDAKLVEAFMVQMDLIANADEDSPFFIPGESKGSVK